MDTFVLEGLETTCRRIMAAGEGLFAWSWDTWPAGMVLSKIDITGRKKAEALLREVFAGSWDHKKIAGAPAKIRGILESVGGVGERQVAYASNPDAPAILIGLWWPWGNGETVSLRLGLAPGIAGCSQDELDDAIRGWFGV
jgi:hypothetical protein